MFAKTQTSFQPSDAHHLEDTGLSLSPGSGSAPQVYLFRRRDDAPKLMERSKLSATVIHAMYRHFQREQLCDTRSMVGDNYEISLSNKGRNMAEVALKRAAMPVRLRPQYGGCSVPEEPLRWTRAGIAEGLYNVRRRPRSPKFA